MSGQSWLVNCSADLPQVTPDLDAVAALNYTGGTTGMPKGLLFPIFSGTTVILLARWDPVGVMAAVEHYRVTRIGMLVDNAVEILDHPDVGKYAMRSLRDARVIVRQKDQPDLPQALGRLDRQCHG